MFTPKCYPRVKKLYTGIIRASVTNWMCDNNVLASYPLVRLLEGEDEGVDISQVILQEVHQLVNVGLLKQTFRTFTDYQNWIKF